MNKARFGGPFLFPTPCESKLTHFEITENALNIRGKCQHIIRSYRVICVVRDWPSGNSEHAFCPDEPDSKVWGSGANCSPAMNHVAGADHSWIASALTALAKGRDSQDHHRGEHTQSHSYHQLNKES